MTNVQKIGTKMENVEWEAIEDGFKARIGECIVVLYPLERYADIEIDREGLDLDQYFRIFAPKTEYAPGPAPEDDETVLLQIQIRENTPEGFHAGEEWDTGTRIVLKRQPKQLDCVEDENDRAWFQAIEDYLSHISADDLVQILQEDGWIE